VNGAHENRAAVHRERHAGGQQKGLEVAVEGFVRLIVLDLHGRLEAMVPVHAMLVHNAPHAAIPNREQQLLVARADPGAGRDRE